jgi:uncharacterized protein DUF202
MSESDNDPRVYFAAERTMLAWLRTGIAVMAFGFVVARFGLFLRLLHAQAGRARIAARNRWISQAPACGYRRRRTRRSPGPPPSEPPPATRDCRLFVRPKPEIWE